MPNPNSLPSQFADLAPFVAEWGWATEQQRHEKLMRSDIAELRAFYDAMLPRMDAIVAYLDGFPLERMPEEARLLLDLALSFMEVAHPIDLKWQSTDIEDKFPADRFRYRGPSVAAPLDTWLARHGAG